MGRASLAALLALLLLPASLAALEEARAAPAGGSGRALVSLDGLPPAPGARLGDAHVLEAFPFARVALVEGSARALAALASLPGVAGVYPEESLSFTMERTRAIVAADPPAGADWPTGRGVTVAVVDSGIDEDHPAFAGRVAANVRIGRGGAVTDATGDKDGHGTHVAGIVGGDGSGSVERRHHGIAPATRLVGVDISDAFTTTSAVRAFAWIHENREAHGIRVVSNSWGREKEDAHYDPDDPVIRASDALVADGIVVVFSAGNRGRAGEATLTTEATNPNVITVGAASAAGRAEPYSSRGPARDAKGKAIDWVKPDLVAPGTGVTSARSTAKPPEGAQTDEELYYTVMNGTSMAAPQVAGAAALLLDAHPQLEPTAVAALLRGTARDLGQKGPDAETGHGMLDVSAALEAAHLYAGGERRVITERRVPVSEHGSVAAAQGQVLLAGTAAQLPPAQAVTLPVVLQTGATQVDLWFNWSGTGEFQAFLVGPAGQWAFEPVRARSLRLVHDAGPGAYRVEARPVGVVAYTPYSLEGAITIREEKMVDAPGEMHSRALPAGGGFFVPQTGAFGLVARYGPSAGGVLALAGLAAVSFALARRR